MRRIATWTAVLALGAGAALAQTKEAAKPAVSPRVAAAQAAKAEVRPVAAKDWMVVAAHPAAAEAGADVLAAGGTAADAMVAVQTVLGLVEPQASGIGGGAFLLYWDAEERKLTTLDGRETAPLAARPGLFLDDGGLPLQFYDAVVGGRSVGTPGVPRLMEAAHARWGKKAWAGLFDPAIRLAQDGFPVSKRLAGAVKADAERLARYRPTADYFLPGGAPLAAGKLLKNPDYAATLKAMAATGADGFYTGPVADAMVAAVRGAEGNPGLLGGMDLALYRVVEREPVCVAYKGYDVCGMGPPSSGGLTVGQALGMLRRSSLAELGPDSIDAWRRIGEATRLAFADRGRYMADSDFVPLPLRGLIDDAYLAERGKLLDGVSALTETKPGQPTWDHSELRGDDVAIELPSTSQIVIVDGFGNVLSMTSSVENSFGSRVFAKGFLLNNQLTDFSFATHDDAGRPIANAVAPGKRPRSSMAPTIVLKDGRPVLAIGSPGGPAIIGFVLQALIAWIDWRMDVQQVVAMPHVQNRAGPFELEAGTGAEALAPGLESLGFEVKIGAQGSGLAAIAIGPVLTGGADPRREGVALGE